MAGVSAVSAVWGIDVVAPELTATIPGGSSMR